MSLWDVEPSTCLDPRTAMLLAVKAVTDHDVDVVGRLCLDDECDPTVVGYLATHPMLLGAMLASWPEQFMTFLASPVFEAVTDLQTVAREAVFSTAERWNTREPGPVRGRFMLMYAQLACNEVLAEFAIEHFTWSECAYLRDTTRLAVLSWLAERLPGTENMEAFVTLARDFSGSVGELVDMACASAQPAQPAIPALPAQVAA